MLMLVVMVAMFTAVVVTRMIQDHRNSGLQDGWYGHSDHSTDRTGTFLGPFA